MKVGHRRWEFFAISLQDREHVITLLTLQKKTFTKITKAEVWMKDVNRTCEKKGRKKNYISSFPGENVLALQQVFCVRDEHRVLNKQSGGTRGRNAASEHFWDEIRSGCCTTSASENWVWCKWVSVNVFAKDRSNWPIIAELYLGACLWWGEKTWRLKITKND